MQFALVSIWSLAAGSFVASLGVWHQNAALRLMLAEHRGRTREPAVVSRVDGKNLSIHLELERTQREISELELAAAARRNTWLAKIAQRASADAEARASGNRDPEKGLARLEYFQDRGRATPADALQTLVWAALNGDDAALEGGLLLDPRARERAETLLAQLPPADGDSFSPEKMGALWFANTVLDAPEAQITDVTNADATHATLGVRGGIGGGEKLQLQLGIGGWQVVVPSGAIESIQNAVGAGKP